MYEALGLLIRGRRETLGLNQGEIAARLEVGQQAVSAWERGTSRPRRNMLAALAVVLEVAETELVDAGAYASTPSGRPPARPLARTLPLDGLTDERFEDLIADVMDTLYPEAHVSRYGGPGETQDGIDILAAGDDGNLATGQCKRHREFGPAKVKEAIAKVTVKAPRHYLFLSRPIATPVARAEAGKHKAWQLWDGEDISRHIRNLPRDQAVRIVDTYFPGQREPFLGVPAPGPWLLPEEYFEVQQTSIFNHDWRLVGRQDQLADLIETTYRSASDLVLVVGAGGVGKTRLLKALADESPAGSAVRIVAGDVTVEPADFELLPSSGGLTVIIDDAHELSDVAGIVSKVLQHNREATVVLATRPYGLRTLKESLAGRGMLPNPVAEIELGDLETDEAIDLARQALGDESPEAVARQLASLTSDSPLATVIGGSLIRQGKLATSALTQDESVRVHIMRGFRDALLNDSVGADSETRQSVLAAVAAVQPFRTNDVSARESLSAIVGKHYDELSRHLRNLEYAGILRRRGQSLRIVPDLLGDVVLSDAAFDKPGTSDTGYLDRIEPLVTGDSSKHLFINVSRVDWQIRNDADHVPSLVESLWAGFRARIEAADIIDRRELVKTLARAAYFQPRRALEMSRWLIDNPTERLDGDHAAWQAFFATDYSSVLQELAAVIKPAAMTEDTLPEALNQLWELAQSDTRPTHYSGQPLHALKDLAEFSIAKPIWFNRRVVDVATTWFADGQPLSPFDVLEPILATEGEESSFRAHTLTLKRFSLDPETIMGLRQQVIDLAFIELTSADLKRSAAAAKFLKASLQYPRGAFGAVVPSDERDEWTPGFVETVERLGAAAASGQLDPAVLVSIRAALNQHDSYGSGPVHDAASQVVDNLPNSIEDLLALTVHDGWGQLLRDRGDDFDAMEAKRVALLDAVIKGLAPLEDKDVVDLLRIRLRAERVVHGTDGFSRPVVAALIHSRPSLAQAVLQALPEAPSALELEQILPDVLAALFDEDAATGLKEIKDLLLGANEERRRIVAHALGWNRGNRPLHEGELDVLLRLAADADVQVRSYVAQGAHQIARTSPSDATRLLATIRFGDDASLADAIFNSFGSNSGVSWVNFSEDEVELIRQDLLTVPSIEKYSVSRVLSERSATDPNWVLALLRDRVQRAEELESSRESGKDYRALPYNWQTHLLVRETDQYLPALRGLIAWISENVESWKRRDLGADLFAEVARPYDGPVVELLDDAVRSENEPTLLAVAAVLEEAPRTFIWTNVVFVRTALNEAARVSALAGKRMRHALWAATVTGVRSGTPGEPFPETIEQRDRSRATAHQLPAGSLEREFYIDMAKSAERDIKGEVEDDIPSDGREW